MILDLYGKVHYTNERHAWGDMSAIVYFAQFYSNLNAYSTYSAGKKYDVVAYIVFASSKKEAADLLNEALSESWNKSNTPEPKYSASRFIQYRYQILRGAASRMRADINTADAMERATSRRKMEKSRKRDLKQRKALRKLVKNI